MGALRGIQGIQSSLYEDSLGRLCCSDKLNGFLTSVRNSRYPRPADVLLTALALVGLLAVTPCAAITPDYELLDAVPEAAAVGGPVLAELLGATLGPELAADLERLPADASTIVRRPR